MALTAAATSVDSCCSLISDIFVPCEPTGRWIAYLATRYNVFDSSVERGTASPVLTRSLRRALEKRRYLSCVYYLVVVPLSDPQVLQPLVLSYWWTHRLETLAWMGLKGSELVGPGRRGAHQLRSTRIFPKLRYLPETEPVPGTKERSL